MINMDKIAKLNLSSETKKLLHVVLIDGDNQCTLISGGINECGECPVYDPCTEYEYPKSKREVAWDKLLQCSDIEYRIKSEKEFKKEFQHDSNVWQNEACWSDVSAKDSMDKYFSRVIGKSDVKTVMRGGFYGSGHYVFDDVWLIMPRHITVDLDSMLKGQDTSDLGRKVNVAAHNATCDNEADTIQSLEHKPVEPTSAERIDTNTTEHKFPSPDEVEKLIDEQVIPDKKPSALDTQVGGNHYKDMPIQPIEFCFKNNLNNLQSNIVKYVVRYPFKNGLEDLKKARHYLDYLIKEMEK